ncbi:hypothetical protein BCR37DRAFT_294984 [Protomyces lactucae-debilis]|uniref:Nuclear rim protein 1 n=1 Tax=Protomyces lactucae-debilis TaxID=2754530 RepID=A0A1Y2FIQ2_PROLT|nr:uncharacterized protein BCR37DRAFT_294984 [Protomyces lactucae-debilis]ORY83126.1 hypothetical protein BCR37DRAFT_294984 [Protomyces lactucae-debilis]
MLDLLDKANDEASTTLFFMTLASFLNVYYLLSRRRTYHVQAPAAVSLPGSPDDRPSSSAAKAMVIWEPSLPSLRLFSILSPLHLFITWQLCLSPYLLFTLLALSATLLGALHLFMQHVQHKQRLYGHVFSEYDRTFVEPRLNIMKRDVGCGTSPDEQGVYVEVHTPKVGILDSRRERGIPKSASMVRMHDWEQTTGGDLPSTPVLWRQQPQLSGISSPAKGMSALQSPVRRGRSPMKPAGWRSSAPGAIGSPAPVFAGGVLGTQRKPRTVPSQLRDE